MKKAICALVLLYVSCAVSGSLQEHDEQAAPVVAVDRQAVMDRQDDTADIFNAFQPAGNVRRHDVALDQRPGFQHTAMARGRQ